MAETAVKLNQREAARLFERGVAAARGGQKRVAAVLLGRAVQYDPRHEQAWLWLSGVLEDPNEIAFCLQSVLSINPHNARARQGLAWLEQRALIPSSTAPAATLEPDGQASAADHDGQGQAGWKGWWRQVRQERGAGSARHEEQRDHESWWVGWRRARRELNRAWVLVWLTCILVVLGTLVLNLALRDAIARNTERIRIASARDEPAADAASQPAPTPILQDELGMMQDARVLAYLSAMEVPRRQLQAAVQTYRDATNQPGGSAIAHAAAARKLRDQIEAERNTIARIKPPPALEQAHASYLAGLEQELLALDEMLEFYGSFSVTLVNRATIRLEHAGKQLAHARAAFTQLQADATTDHGVSPYRAR